MNTHMLLALATWCLVVALLTGCSPRVSYDRAPDQDFSAFDTWHWAEPQWHIDTDLDDLGRQRFVKAVASALAAQGLALTPESPWRVQVLIDEQQRITSNNSGFSFGFGAGSRNRAAGVGIGTGTDVYDYDQRRLVVIVLRDEAEVWRGSTSWRLRGDTPERLDQEAQRAADAIAKKLRETTQ